ncbi:uncharacterized protein LOC109727809 [Ananas comosus]|uniref:Carboxypeptidase n=1 Tax=Ananas comosus TaxID=4615 RepID=A0A6P5GY57_ANACO|nr:uncharacterized protein LOC109727809 [Ananas comosus]
MRALRVSLLLITVFVAATVEARQKDQLRRLIDAKKASWALERRDSAAAAFDASEIMKRDVVVPQDGSAEGDKIEALPGQPKHGYLPFGQYGGYVTVDATNGRALFYYFTEAPVGAAAKPLVLWLNGGPGCSSLGYGAMEELGPFRVNSDGKTLYKNRHAWNNVANVIFLESPVGVGFAYSNTSSDYDTNGDKRTATDSLTFLVNWLERFPQYKNRDFYITGESYAGHYIPQLAAAILHYNKINNASAINLKGIFVGNAYVDNAMNDKGAIEFLWNHAIISDEAYAKVVKECIFNDNSSYTDACNEAQNETYNMAGNIDLYNVYAPICINDSNGTSYSYKEIPGYDACIDNYVSAYLNAPAVQKALHAVPTDWGECVDFPWVDAPYSTVPTIKQLTQSGLRVWLYSGDVDDVVPITATRYSVKDLNLPIKTPWRAWYTKYEVGGYVEEYEGLTLATVRGAGHMVPTYQPERAVVLFHSFLKGILPPDWKTNEGMPNCIRWSMVHFLRFLWANKKGLMAADKIDALPGQPEGVDFVQYSGYVTVEPKKGRALFYYFAESPQNSSTKPLVLWLNGDSTYHHLSLSTTIISILYLSIQGKIPQDGSAEGDKIEALPGQPKHGYLPFGQYGGYVTVNAKNGRALFYYFTEAPVGAAVKPLVLWLNGGPGCSSLGNGAMEELGPFRVNSDGKTLYKNRHAWNNVANVIFLESPVGVGFAYSNTSSDYDTNGDKRTAADSLTFLVNWLERFPQYKNRDFYITGESYAGHYIPQLAAAILHYNKINNASAINLKGIFVGNAYVDNAMNDKGAIEFLWNHAIISDEAYAKVVKECIFNDNSSYTDACNEAQNETYNMAGNIDQYNVYAPICISYSNGTSYSYNEIPGYDACIDNYVTAYLNAPAVQKALHAVPTDWGECVDFPWVDAPYSTVPTIKQLTQSGLRVWLYSGDVDDVVPITATRYSVKDLNLPIKTPWRAWYTKYEVGGYVEEYEGLTLATVRGAGHMVPSYQPERALVLFHSFLKGILPPDLS